MRLFRFHNAVFVGMTVLALSTSPAAQEVLDTLFSPYPGGRFGQSVDGVGDLNGDGWEDFIVGVPRSTFGDRSDPPGEAIVYSGQDRSVLFHLFGDHGGDMFGQSVAGVRDLNLDGVPDFAVGAPSADGPFNSAGFVRAYSGVDGSVLFTRYGEQLVENFGVRVAGIGDVDGDGHADVLASGSGSTSNTGVVRVLSGATSFFIHELGMFGVFYGSRIAALGDIDGDGISEFGVVAGASGPTGQGQAFVHSGADASLIYTFDAVEGAVKRVAGVGDVNGDMIPDIGISELQSAPTTGGVLLYSGATGSLLLQIPDGNGCLGAVLVPVGDQNGDGIPDLIVGDGCSGVVFLFSGADTSLLYTVREDAPGETFGSFGSGSADVNGDGIQDWLLSSPNTRRGGGGRVRIHLGATPIGTRFCTATLNSTNRPARIHATGTNSVSANSLLLIADFVPPGMNGLFVYSPDTSQTPLGDGFLCLGTRTQGFINRLAPTTAGPLGRMTHALDVGAPPVPDSTITAGSTWHFQAFFRDLPAGNTGFNFSDGLGILFAP